MKTNLRRRIRNRKALEMQGRATTATSRFTRCTMPVRAKDGKLFFDFFWRGVRCKEYTGLADKGENRRLCERKMAIVHAAIKGGSFDYRAHFPRGSRLALFYPDDHSRDGHTISLGEYLARWHERRSPILPDGSVVRDADPASFYLDS